MQRNQYSENMEKNPFVIKSYESKELFCDREKELQLMVRNCANSADMTLISQRRMGKTGLILRLFDELSELEPELKTIYVDIYASRSLADFIKLVAEASLRAFPKKDSMGEKFLGFLKSLRPYHGRASTANKLSDGAGERIHATGVARLLEQSVRDIYRH